MTLTQPLGRPLRLAVIGGGPESFIGSIHRGGATLDGHFRVVAGAFSSDPERSRRAAEMLHVDRGYANGTELINAEARHGERPDVVAIMTPNNSHFALAKQALKAGFHVMCEKPLTLTATESDELVRIVKRTDRLFCVAYAYTGFPMVRQARQMIAEGALGDIRMVNCEYFQGHLAKRTEAEINTKDWHFDPSAGGASLILGEIGTHAWHLAGFVSGMQPEALTAEVCATVPGRTADDYATVLTRYTNGARGMIWVTQAAAGAEHGLKFRIFGTKGGLEWHQQQPNELIYRPIDQPCQVLVKGGPGLSEAANRISRVVIGHPEGYQEAFSSLYRDLAEAVVARETDQTISPHNAFPTVEAGAAGMHFIETAQRSVQNGGVWTQLAGDTDS